MTQRHFPWILAALLFAGCGGGGGTVPQPSTLPRPPAVLGRGSLAVVNIAQRNAKRVWAFPPHGENFTREFLVHGSQYELNSLAFDRRGHLYIGFNDTSSGGKYNVVEVNVQSGEVVREIRVPQWSDSSVATDDQDNLYVNTKSFIGGNVEIF